MKVPQYIGIAICVLIPAAVIFTYTAFLSPTYKASICSTIDHTSPIQGGKCVEMGSILIIRHTENYSNTSAADDSVAEKCAKQNAIAVSSYSGGAAGSKYIGCSPENNFKVRHIYQGYQKMLDA